MPDISGTQKTSDKKSGSGLYSSTAREDVRVLYGLSFLLPTADYRLVLLYRPGPCERDNGAAKKTMWSSRYGRLEG